MPTLHIEHSITDFETWKAAFEGFADFRLQGGVRRYRLQRPVDDPQYIVVDLDFDTADEATKFREALKTKVWPSREFAPTLVGTPQTKILEFVEEQ